MVSGFDPFDLDTEIRRGNPSGSAVLRLDGRILRVADRRVQVQAVVFPVRYTDFDAGIVEDAFRPHLAAGEQRADMFVTNSQGRPGAFDLEVWNGRRRSTPPERGDNNNLWGGGTPTAPVVFPGVGPGTEFIRATLPHQAMLTADQQPFPGSIGRVAGTRRGRHSRRHPCRGAPDPGIMIVLDNSALLEGLVARSPSKELLVVISNEQLHVPHLLDYEFRNALSGLVLGRKISSPRAEGGAAHQAEFALD